MASVSASQWLVMFGTATGCLDAILVVLVLRGLLRDAGADLLRRHWPGPAGRSTR